MSENNKVVIDENVINTLVNIYAERAKTYIEQESEGILERSLREALTQIGISVEGTPLEEKKKDKIPEEVDTTQFEEELRKYFTEHYSDLLDTGYNQFLSKFAEQDRGEKGELVRIAMRCKIDPEKFKYFGSEFTIQDGLVAEEDISYGGIEKIYYSTAEGINNRVSELYYKIMEQKNKEDSNEFFIDALERSKYDYLEHAKKNGFKIKNKDVFEEIPVDDKKVQTIAKTINKIINDSDIIESNDNTQLFVEEITRRYSEIMSYFNFNFLTLESVQELLGEDRFLIHEIYLNIKELNEKNENSLEELDGELTKLKKREDAAKDLCEKYEGELNKNENKNTKEEK